MKIQPSSTAKNFESCPQQRREFSSRLLFSSAGLSNQSLRISLAWTGEVSMQYVINHSSPRNYPRLACKVEITGSCVSLRQLACKLCLVFLKSLYYPKNPHATSESHDSTGLKIPEPFGFESLNGGLLSRALCLVLLRVRRSVKETPPGFPHLHRLC